MTKFLLSYSTKIREKIDEITSKYGISCLSVVGNIQGTLDIELDQNIFYEPYAKMEREIRDLIPNINDIYHKSVV